MKLWQLDLNLASHAWILEIVLKWFKADQVQLIDHLELFRADCAQLFDYEDQACLPKIWMNHGGQTLGLYQ